MGTRADFFVGVGPSAEWIGSIAFDGCPDGSPAPIFKARTEARYRAIVTTMLADLRKDGSPTTTPDEGWPWPWPDHRTTDFAYAWDGDGVVISRYGRPWITRVGMQTAGDAEYDRPKLGDDEVVDMAKRRMSTDQMLAKSGLIVLGVK
jgi:hypothetical protein